MIRFGSNNKIKLAMGIRIGIGIGLSRRRGAGGPFSPDSFADTELWFTERSGYDLLETHSGASHNAKILPSCQLCGGTIAAVHTETDITNGSIEVHFKQTSAFGTTTSIIGTASTAYAIAIASSTTVRVRMNSINKIFTIPAFNQTIKNVLRVDFSNATGTTIARVFMNGVESTTEGQGFTTDVTYAFPFTRMGTGAGYIQGDIYYYKLIEAGSTVLECYPTGLGAYNYDISGNNNHGLFNSPTTSHVTYSLNASTYYLDSGYRVFTKAATANEYVPIGVSTATIEAAGYTLYRTFTGSSDTINQGIDSLLTVIDFDPTESTDALLDIFDKSNGTIHIATGSMDYYNSDLPYAWRIDELSHPNVYAEYFNAAYQNRLFVEADITLNGATYDNLNLKGVLSYGEPKTGTDFWNIIDYCLNVI